MKSYLIKSFVFSITLLITLSLAFSVQAKNNKANKEKTGNQATYASTSQESTPPGWSKGKKTGWRGSKYPPGWSKWNKNKKDKWVKDRDNAVEEIEVVFVEYQIPERKGNEILNAFEQAIIGGTMVYDAGNRLVTALKDEKQRKNLMIDTTQSVLELMKD